MGDLGNTRCYKLACTNGIMDNGSGLLLREQSSNNQDITNKMLSYILWQHPVLDTNRDVENTLTKTNFLQNLSK